MLRYEYPIQVGVGIFGQFAAIGKNLAEKGLVFVKQDHKIRRLNDLDGGTDRSAGFGAGRQAINSVRVVAVIIRALFVNGRRPRLNVSGLKIRRGVEQVAFVDSPDAGKIRLAVRSSWSRGGEVGLAVGRSGQSRNRAGRPLR